MTSPADVVLLHFLNSCCSLLVRSTLFSFSTSIILFSTGFSKTLDVEQRLEIGRQLDNSFLLAFLWMGITLAISHYSGNWLL
jgi:hypothetical protein